ncbi:hypothetical protein BGZ76_005107, partial [Entomortierella beljakovae]
MAYNIGKLGRSTHDSNMQSEHEDTSIGLQKPMRASDIDRSNRHEFRVTGDEIGGGFNSKPHTPAGSGYNSPLPGFLTRDIAKDHFYHSSKSLEHQTNVGLDTPELRAYCPLDRSQDSPIPSLDLDDLCDKETSSGGFEINAEDFPELPRSQGNLKDRNKIGDDSTDKKAHGSKRRIESKVFNDALAAKRLGTYESYSEYRELKPTTFRHSLSDSSGLPKLQPSHVRESHFNRHNQSRVGDVPEMNLGSLFQEEESNRAERIRERKADLASDVGLVTIQPKPLYSEPPRSSLFPSTKLSKRTTKTDDRLEAMADSSELRALFQGGSSNEPTIEKSRSLMDEQEIHGDGPKRADTPYPSTFPYASASDEPIKQPLPRLVCSPYEATQGERMTPSPAQSRYSPGPILSKKTSPLINAHITPTYGSLTTAYLGPEVYSSKITHHSAVDLRQNDVTKPGVVTLHHTDIPNHAAVALYHNHATANLHYSELPKHKGIA